MDVDAIIKPLLLKDLRIQCRQRKLSPAGSRDDLAERLKEHMLATNDFALRNEDGSVMSGSTAAQLFGQTNPGNNYTRPEGQNVGNFLGDRPSSRVLAAPGGKSNISLGHDGTSATPPVAQPAAPAPVAEPQEPAVQPAPKKASFLDSMTAKIAGHASGQGAMQAPKVTPPAYSAPQKVENVAEQPQVEMEGEQATGDASGIGVKNNNYNRPSGQNVDNFITDRPSSRVLAPPGGGSSIRFG